MLTMTLPILTRVRDERPGHPQDAQSRQTLRGAAILNANARQVDRRIRARVNALMPGATYLTRSLDEARQIVAALMDEEVELLFAGGGDGTIVQLINLVMDEADRRALPEDKRPMLGILPFGTGNALAGHLEIDSALSDLAQIQHGAPTRVQGLPLLRCNGRLSFFAGVGADAMIVNDYDALKRAVHGKPIERMVTGLGGYFASIFARTLPRALSPRFHFSNIEIINHGDRAWRLDHEGRKIQSYERGQTLYSGPAMVAAASTVSCFGFNLKAFPFAQAAPDRFHLRLYAGGPLEPALHIPQIFAGTFRSSHLHDFLAQDVQLHMDAPSPLQIGGDAHGWEQSLHLQLSPEPLSILSPQRRLLH